MTPNQLELHRTALALVRANHSADVDGVIAVLSMVKEPDIGDFLAAMADLVAFGFRANPNATYEQMCEKYAAVLDKTDDDLSQ